MIQHHSTLKLIYGYEPCFVKRNDEYKEYPSIFEVRVGDYLHKFEDKKATLHQKNDFWRHFSERIWSYDDFTFTFAPAAASLLTGALRYKIWFNPLEVFRILSLSILYPHAPSDLDDKLLGEENRGVAAMFKQLWFRERFDHFAEHGKFDLVPESINKHEIVDHELFKHLMESSEQGTWTEEAWQAHCNKLIESDFYHNNVVAIMQHEMLHIMWEHLTRMGDRDPMLHNIATDYAINQQLPFSPELRTILITDDNRDFFTKFVTGISIWRAYSSTKDAKALNKLKLSVTDKPEKFAAKVDDLAQEFVYENDPLKTMASFFGVSSNATKNKYLGKDSDFYYEVLDYVKEDIKENGQGGTLDDHSMWRKNDEEQKGERGQSGGQQSGSEGEGESGDDDSDGQGKAKGKGDGSPKNKKKGSGGDGDEKSGDKDDADSKNKKDGNKKPPGKKVSTAKKGIESDDGEETGSKKGDDSGSGKDGNDLDEARDGDQIKIGDKDRGNMRGGYEHPGFRKVIGRQEAKNAFKAAAERAGYNPDDPEDLERALNDIPGLAPLRQMFHEWFAVKAKNWRKELTAFLRHCVNPTELEHTMLREHRALDDTFPGKKRDVGFQLIIGIDTSGSISATDFNDFMGQIHKMARDCDFDKVRIIQCHSRISDDRTWKVRSARKLKEFSIAEVGGTKMEPVYAKLEREGNKLPLILFTDGYIDDFPASRYTKFKHIMFLSRGCSGNKERLEAKGFKVLCQDDEPQLMAS